MHVKMMKIIDRFVGPPVCALLHLFSRFTQRRSIADDRREKFLFIKFFGIGSIVMIFPAVKSLRKEFPDAEFVFLTFRSHKSISDLTDVFDRYLYIDADKIFPFIFETIKTILILRQERFTRAFCFEYFARFPVILAFLGGIPLRYGFFHSTLSRGQLINCPVTLKHNRHITGIFSALTEAAGAQEIVDNQNPSVIVNELMQDSLLKRLSLNGNFISINPNCGPLVLERRWAGHCFEELAKRLLIAYPSMKLCFIGSADESDYVQSIIDGLPRNLHNRVLNLAGQMDLKELAALFKTSKAVVSNDSGPLHIAVAAGAKTVSIFGPESPHYYGPKGDNHIVCYLDLPCSPCIDAYNAKTCQCHGTNICVSGISVDQVFHAVQRLLDENITAQPTRT